MSAADPLRSWRSADKSKCGDHGEVRSGGPKARKNDARLARKMQIRSKVGSRDREVVAAKSQRFGPQSRAPTYQTDLLGGKRGADAKTHQTEMLGGKRWSAEAPTHHAARPAMTYGILAGGNHGHRQKWRNGGPQSRLWGRYAIRRNGGLQQNPIHLVMRLQRVLSAEQREEIVVQETPFIATPLQERCRAFAYTCNSKRIVLIHRSRGVCGEADVGTKKLLASVVAVSGASATATNYRCRR